MRLTQSRFSLSTLRRKNELFCSIDLWGFMSVTLVLFVTLMVGTGMRYHYSIFGHVDRPKGIHSTLLRGVVREDALRVIVTRDGRVFFGSYPVGRGDLTEMVRKGVRTSEEKKLYLAVDARAKYGDVKMVLDQIRLAGIENVSFLTEETHL
jgi:biopolymer transport protein ExbD